MYSNYNEIIVGQGLAGTALGWALRGRSRRILLIDRNTPITSSRVAAGLMTPITGQRLVKSIRWDDYWPYAVHFYRDIEQQTKVRFLNFTRMVRLFASDAERESAIGRLASRHENLITFPDPLIDPSDFDCSFGGFEITTAGRLDIPAYLDASRGVFTQDGQYLNADLSIDEVELHEASISIPSLLISANRIIFCQGFEPTENRWFNGISFTAAKGEILTLRIGGLAEERVVHRGVSLAPIGNSLFRCGSTYNWTNMDCIPSISGRDEICSRLREFLHCPFDVVDHQAAVRPVLRNQSPLMGLHPEYPQLGFFNGLGSKGSLQSPWLAEHFAGFLSGENPLEREFNLQRCFPAVRK